MLRRSIAYRSCPPLITIVGSAHKVGSTWLFQMLETLLKPQYDFEGILVPREMRNFGHTDTFDSLVAVNFLSQLKGRWLFKTHKNIHPDAEQYCKFITVHRDLRDACVSMVHFGTNLPTYAGGYQSEIKKLPFDERLHFELDRSYNLERAEYWWKHPADLRVCYEELKADSTRVLESATRSLEIGSEYTEDLLNDISHQYDFKTIARRPAGEEDTRSFLRKGIVGDWKHVFKDDHIEHFKSALDGRWNQLLVEMGYESATNW
ncbi:sulfotransferase domain-containing protein [Rhodopirellula sp. SWK7]|uniref:sulfotransferase domain-containing protein n=1 Tax=Rhodopirellula sp. SWK7 TaxID=595460 RepID=UPI001F1F4BC4|nr:sulfotransferase domain-containing protein [Rhodopirellula sp. SWK7]